MSSDPNDRQQTNGTASSREEAEQPPADPPLDHSITTYQTDNPRWLWRLFTSGPADDADRYGDRVTALIARDVLEHFDDLSGNELEQALALVREHNV